MVCVRRNPPAKHTLTWVLLLLLCCQTTAANDMAIVRMSLNGMDKGEHFVTVLPDGDVEMTENSFSQLGFATSVTGPVRVSAIPGLENSELDQMRGTLVITVDASQLQQRQLTFSEPRKIEGDRLADPIFFVNYSASASVSNEGQWNFEGLPLELGLSHRLGLITTNVSMMPDGSWRRGQTQYLYDDVERAQRVILGDLQAVTGSTPGGGPMAGVQLASNFGTQPWLNINAGAVIQGELATPSEVEVWVDGVMLTRETMQAGPLRIEDSSLQGQGLVELIVRDAFGEEQRYQYDYYASSQMLATGIHEYSYSLGVSREQNGLQLQYGGAPIFSGYSRFGLSRRLTGGLAVESDGANSQLGLSTAFVLGSSGDSSIDWAISQREQRSGQRARFRYSNQFFGVSASFIHERQSRHYGSVFSPSSEQRRASLSSLSLGANLARFGTFTPRWRQTRYFEEETSLETQLSYSVRLPWSVQLSLTGTVSKQGPTESSRASLRLFRRFDNGFSVTGFVSDNEGDVSFGLQLQRSVAGLTGFGYQARIEQQGSGLVSSYAQGRHQSRSGETTVSTTQFGDRRSYRSRYSGGAVWADGRLHAGRSIRNGVAIVTVNGVPEAGVRLNNQLVGKTDQHGRVLVGGLQAFTDNTIQVDISNLPMGYNVDQSSKMVVPGFRGGGVVRFDITKLQAIEGRIFFAGGEEREAAQYAALEVTGGSAALSSFVGFGGMFYIERIEAGTYQARARRKNEYCVFDLVVPDSVEPIVSLGDIDCEVEEGGP